jgi:hypothetical protein
MHHRLNQTRALDQQHQLMHQDVQVAVVEIMDQLKELKRVVMIAVTQLFKAVVG